MKISNINFQGKYKVDINQHMPDRRAKYKRDSRLDYWAQFSANPSKIYKYLDPALDSCKIERIKDGDILLAIVITENYIKDDKKKYVIYDIPDCYNKEFEDTMQSVGQEFEKIG